MYKKEQISFEFFTAPDITSLSDLHKSFVLKSREASHQAYAPYSQFKVGAALLLDNSEWVLASNTENPAFPSCMCAERAAIFQARDRFPNHKVKVLAITANPINFKLTEPVTPCGTCRQVIAEQERLQGEPIELILSGQSGPIHILKNARSLLPLQFTMDELRKA